MAHIEWNKIVDTLQAGLAWFVLGLTAVCVGVLILFDTLVGAGFMHRMTQGNWVFALLISLSTTGLLIALLFLGYRSIASPAGWVLIVGAVMVYGIDTYFDALSADILRFGQLMVIAELPQVDKSVQVLYRLLIGGMSTVGEPLAISIITGMGVVKEIIRNALPTGGGSQPRQGATPPRQYRQDVPSSIPRRNGGQPIPHPYNEEG